jgi:hypothetical protein
MPSEAPAGLAATASPTIAAVTVARRRDFGDGLFVVMSMGVTVVMLMLAMFIMVMMIAMIVNMIVAVRCVVMTRMIVPAMIMCMVVVTRLGRVAMAAAGIGAAFGIERRFDLDHPRTQPLHHRLDDVIAPDPQAFADDLGRQMAVAEMPGNPDQMMRVGDADLEQRFRRRDHLDQPAIVEHQRIAAAQCDGIFEVEQEFQPPRRRHRHSPPVTIVEIEHDRIGGRLRPAMLRTDLGGSHHVDLLF